MIKDKINLYKNYSDLELICDVCQKLGHFSHNCPILHYQPNYYFVISRYNFYDQKRRKFTRSFKKKIGGKIKMETIQKDWFKFAYIEYEFLEELFDNFITQNIELIIENEEEEEEEIVAELDKKELPFSYSSNNRLEMNSRKFQMVKNSGSIVLTARNSLESILSPRNTPMSKFQRRAYEHKKKSSKIGNSLVIKKRTLFIDDFEERESKIMEKIKSFENYFIYNNIEKVLISFNEKREKIMKKNSKNFKTK